MVLALCRDTLLPLDDCLRTERRAPQVILCKIWFAVRLLGRRQHMAHHLAG